MSRLRFAHIYAILLIVSALAAFVLPQRGVGAAGGGGTFLTGIMQAALAPVAMPVRSLVALVVPPKAVTDTGGPNGSARTDATLVEENAALRIELASLLRQLEDLKVLNRDRELLGPVRLFCIPVNVIGYDTRPGRDTLSVSVPAGGYVSQDMPVLTSGGLLGRTFAAGLGAAKVRLITDTESRIAVRFGRFVQDAAGRVTFVELQTPEPLAQGLGRGVMSVRNLAAKDVAQAGISIGDWVVLADGSFPSNLQGFKVGQVTEIGARADGPLHADIRIAPAAKLAGLRQVMVMNRKE